MLYANGKYFSFFLLLKIWGKSEDGQVIALGRSAGKDDFFFMCANEIGDLLARVLNACFGFPVVAMDPAGRISKAFHEVGLHEFEYFGIERSSGMTV